MQVFVNEILPDRIATKNVGKFFLQLRGKSNQKYLKKCPPLTKNRSLPGFFKNILTVPENASVSFFPATLHKGEYNLYREGKQKLFDFARLNTLLRLS